MTQQLNHQLSLTPGPEQRCRHLAVQTIVTSICLDCGDITEAHDELTGIEVRGDLSDLPDLANLPIYIKDD